MKQSKIFTFVISVLVLMPIVYSCVTRGPTVLADLSLRGGDFQGTTLSLMRSLRPGYVLNEISVGKESFRYHILSQDGITFICVTEPSFESKRAHGFLNMLCRIFFNSSLIRTVAFTQPYEYSAYLHQLLAQQMVDHNSHPQTPSNLNQVQDQVNEVKVILKDNINKVLERGERLDDLVGKTDDLQATADSFQRTSTRVSRKFWWKNMKMMIIIGVVVLFIVILIILLATGVIPS